MSRDKRGVVNPVVAGSSPAATAKLFSSMQPCRDRSPSGSFPLPYEFLLTPLGGFAGCNALEELMYERTESLSLLRQHLLREHSVAAAFHLRRR